MFCRFAGDHIKKVLAHAAQAWGLIYLTKIPIDSFYETILIHG